MEISHLAQQLAPSLAPERWRGKDQRHVFPRRLQRLELRHRLLRRGHADDAVAPRIPVDQLAFDVAQRTLVFVDGEKDGDGHGYEKYRPGCDWSTSDAGRNPVLAYSNRTASTRATLS